MFINHNINYVKITVEGTVADSQQRFPFLAWQNEDIREDTQYHLETVFQSPVSNREPFVGNPGHVRGAADVPFSPSKNPVENKKYEVEARLTNVLQNAIFSNEKDYIQLYKDLKNEKFVSGTEAGSLRQKQDKKSDIVENSGNYEEQVTFALENAISLYPYKDYTKLYRELKESLSNSATTSQPFIEEKSDRFPPETRNPSSREEDSQQQLSALYNFENKVTPQSQVQIKHNSPPFYNVGVDILHCISRNKSLTENPTT